MASGMVAENSGGQGLSQKPVQVLVPVPQHKPRTPLVATAPATVHNTARSNGPKDTTSVRQAQANSRHVPPQSGNQSHATDSANDVNPVITVDVDGVDDEPDVFTSSQLAAQNLMLHQFLEGQWHDFLCCLRFVFIFSGWPRHCSRDRWHTNATRVLCFCFLLCVISILPEWIQRHGLGSGSNIQQQLRLRRCHVIFCTSQTKRKCSTKWEQQRWRGRRQWKE